MNVKNDSYGSEPTLFTQPCIETNYQIILTECNEQQ